jgi:ABC-2 type transport system ATP-binding protein
MKRQVEKFIEKTNNDTVRVENLRKQFGEFVAVNDISFSVKKGEIFGFLGPNGAGKSTTIKMLCGILMPGGGTGSVNGFDVIKEQDQIKNSIGYMSQKFSLYDDMTTIENLEFFGGIYGLDDKTLKQNMELVIDLAGIDARKNDLVKQLPGGIKQRLSLGCAILHDPPILFLDEPTSGVDPIMRRNFWDIIYKFSEMGKTIFVTTHYMDEAEHCDRIALIISGSIIELDSPEKLKDGLKYKVYSLEVENFLKIFDAVSSMKGIFEAAVFGSNIHILCDKKTDIRKELASILKKAGIKKYNLHEIRATLEDVFVTSARQHGV